MHYHQKVEIICGSSRKEQGEFVQTRGKNSRGQGGGCFLDKITSKGTKNRGRGGHKLVIWPEKMNFLMAFRSANPHLCSCGAS